MRDLTAFLPRRVSRCQEASPTWLHSDFLGQSPGDVGPAKSKPWLRKPSVMPEPLTGGGRSSDDGQVMLPLLPWLLPCLPREGVVLAGQSLQQQVNKPTFLGTDALQAIKREGILPRGTRERQEGRRQHRVTMETCSESLTPCQPASPRCHHPRSVQVGGWSHARDQGAPFFSPSAHIPCVPRCPGLCLMTLPTQVPDFLKFLQ